MDPITGAVERIGWLAVNVNANDVATFGVEPAFLFSCILLPENADRKIVESICTQMDAAAKDLGVAIVGGHCESTLGLASPIVVGCIMGLTEKGRYVTAGGAKAGDKLVLTKSTGIEGTAILASDREQELKKTVSAAMLRNAKNFYGKISVVNDALTAYKTGGVHAMHDPTEGGVAGGIHEMADASSLGVKVFEEKIPVQPETAKICSYFEIDPLQLISSGALLISAEAKSADEIIKNLEQQQIEASVIGEFLENAEQRLLVRRNGKMQPLPRPLSDHLWTALRR
jgi:hydrogenase maturation factor